MMGREMESGAAESSSHRQQFRQAVAAAVELREVKVVYFESRE